MTLEKTTTPSAFIRNNFIQDFPTDKGKLIRSPSLPKPVVVSYYSKLSQDNLNLSSRRILNRALSDNTFGASSSVAAFSNKIWESSHLVPFSTDRKYQRKVSYGSSTHEVKLQASFYTHISESSEWNRSFKRIPESLQINSSLKKNGLAPTEWVSKTSQKGVFNSKSNTCSREISLNSSRPMPKSSGQSSRSSALKRSDKKGLKEAVSDHRESALPLVDHHSPNKRRPFSADGQQKETTTCSFFYFIRKKKKVSRSTSPDTHDRKPNRKHSRSRSLISCSSAQSPPPSERAFSPSEKDCLLSEQSLTSSKIPQPPSVTSPSATTPLLTSTSTPSGSKRQKYTSRSRSKHRRDRRHRTSRRSLKTQPEDRLRLEDLPPHPSLLNTRSRSEPSILYDKPSVSNNLDSSCNNKYNNSNQINNSDTNSRLRKNSKQESSVHTKSAAVSSGSGGNRKESTGDSALKDKSLHSVSKTDIEDDSHCQFTTSSSDQQSRRTYRSQSLPSFRGDRFLPDADTKVISDAEDFEYCPTDMKDPLHLSLCGCGFLGMYHLGVVSCLTLRGMSFLERVDKVGGASAGALMAAVLVTARDKIEESADHVQNLAKEIRRKPLGALTPGYNFTRSLRYMLEDILPDDAHESAQGKLFVSLTNADTKKNEMMSDFRSRDELIEALIASCYIPVYAGIKPPVIRGKKYIDGGLSDNLPRFDTGRTITVSPFDGKSDIRPKKGQEVEKKAHFISVHNQDIQVTMNNFKKGVHAFFPPKRQTLQEYFEKGRYDAGRFLIREGLYEINITPQSKTVLYESSV